MKKKVATVYASSMEDLYEIGDTRSQGRAYQYQSFPGFCKEFDTIITKEV